MTTSYGAKLEFVLRWLKIGLLMKNSRLSPERFIDLSVIVNKRTESRFEPIYKASKIREELILLRNRDFGLKDMYKFARTQYQNGKELTANPSKYIFYLAEVKSNLDNSASLIETYTKSSNRIYSITEADWGRRISYQNKVLFQIEYVLNELQNLVKIFNVDINLYKGLVLLLYEERNLINRWRKVDSKRRDKLRV